MENQKPKFSKVSDAPLDMGLVLFLFGFPPKTFKNLHVFMRFGKRVAPGWLARPAGWNTRFDFQKASITYVLHCFLCQKQSKTYCFHTFSEASKCRISQYSATLSPFAILAPKCQFHEAFLRVTFKKHGNFQSGAR